MYFSMLPVLESGWTANRGERTERWPVKRSGGLDSAARPELLARLVSTIDGKWLYRSASPATPARSTI